MNARWQTKKQATIQKIDANNMSLEDNSKVNRSQQI